MFVRSLRRKERFTMFKFFPVFDHRTSSLFWKADFWKLFRTTKRDFKFCTCTGAVQQTKTNNQRAMSRTLDFSRRTVQRTKKNDGRDLSPARGSLRRAYKANMTSQSYRKLASVRNKTLSVYNARNSSSIPNERGRNIWKNYENLTIRHRWKHIIKNSVMLRFIFVKPDENLKISIAPVEKLTSTAYQEREDAF